MNTFRYLTPQEIIAINAAVIHKYSPGEHIGVKDFSPLESALFRQQTSVFGNDAYRTTFEKAAALFESLGQNHPFQNANKRTAFTAMVIFLRYNGHRFSMDTKSAEDLTVNMVNHHYSFEEIAEIIRKHTKDMG